MSGIRNIVGRNVQKAVCLTVIQCLVVLFAASQAPATSRIPSGVSISGVATPAAGTQVAQRVIVNDTEWAYLVWLPPAYDATSSKVWPTLIFYGTAGDMYSGGSGNITTFFTSNFENGGPALYMQTPANYKFISDRFIVISPFINADVYKSAGGQPWLLKGLHNHLKATFKIDPAQISMLGYCGGSGVIFNYCEKDSAFASHLVLCSFNDTWFSTVDLTKACALKNIPFRHYADQTDPMVPYANQVAVQTAIKACGGTKDSLITSNIGMHEIWGAAHIANTAGIYDWMLSGVTTPVEYETSRHDNVTNALSLDMRLSPADRMEVLDVNGHLLYKLGGNGSTANQMIPKLDRGMYLVRIMSGNRSFARIVVAR